MREKSILKNFCGRSGQEQSQREELYQMPVLNITNLQLQLLIAQYLARFLTQWIIFLTKCMRLASRLKQVVVLVMNFQHFDQKVPMFLEQERIRRVLSLLWISTIKCVLQFHRREVEEELKWVPLISVIPILLSLFGRSVKMED